MLRKKIKKLVIVILHISHLLVDNNGDIQIIYKITLNKNEIFESSKSRNI